MMNNLLKQRKPLIATAVVLCLLVFVGGWFLLISPQKAKVDELKGEVATQDSSNQSLRSQVAALQALAAKLPAQRAALAAIQAKIPTSAAIPDLVRALSKAADDAGVTLTGITPSTPAVLTTA